MQCKNNNMEIEVYETSESGNALTPIKSFKTAEKKITISVNSDITFQTITGIGGSFTEASASLLNQMGQTNRDKILQA